MFVTSHRPENHNDHMLIEHFNRFNEETIPKSEAERARAKAHNYEERRFHAMCEMEGEMYRENGKRYDDDVDVEDYKEASSFIARKQEIVDKMNALRQDYENLVKKVRDKIEPRRKQLPEKVDLGFKIIELDRKF